MENKSLEELVNSALNRVEENEKILSDLENQRQAAIKENAWYRQFWRNHKGKIMVGVATIAVVGTYLFYKYKSQTSIADDIDTVSRFFSDGISSMQTVLNEKLEEIIGDLNLDSFKLPNFLNSDAIYDYIAELEDKLQELTDMNISFGGLADTSAVADVIESIQILLDKANEALLNM